MAERSRAAQLNYLLARNLALAVACAAGCMTPVQPLASSRSAYSATSRNAERQHTVAAGETVYHIAHQYGVTSERLMAANHLTDSRSLYVGEVLTIPGHPMADASVVPLSDLWSPPRADRQFAWPVTAGQLSSPFGMRNGTMHDGVDIDAPVGTPIHAADDGAVIYAGRLHGYGNVVIIQHSGGYVTVYGHNERNLVRAGERVGRGQTIAQLGASGRATGPNLHFEVRYNNHPQNPMAYLAQPGVANGITFARNAAD